MQCKTIRSKAANMGIEMPNEVEVHQEPEPDCIELPFFVKGNYFIGRIYHYNDLSKPIKGFDLKLPHYQYSCKDGWVSKSFSYQGMCQFPHTSFSIEANLDLAKQAAGL